MSQKKFLSVFIALIIAAVVAAGVATFVVSGVENRSRADVQRSLDLNGHPWVTTEVDGLQVILTGEAPDEATRFRALSIAGNVIDANRIRDMMDVTDRDAIEPPRFSVEILRNDGGVTLIGLIPAETDRDLILKSITEIVSAENVTDLLETADYPTPEGWNDSVEYGVSALAILARSKISIFADRVAIKAISDSTKEKRTFETDLRKRTPYGLRVTLDISAPRPVITPFRLRYLVDENGSRFDSCSTDTEEGRSLIIAAAKDAGMASLASCTIGLGIPSPTWNDAVIIGINELTKLGGGSITFSDADVTLIALDTIPQATFDRVVGELAAALPEVFSLHSVLPEPVKIDGTGEGSGPPEFIATRSPEGLVDLRGRIATERSRAVAESFARALFGAHIVNGAMRLDDELPNGWSTRVLTSLEVLSYLNHGSVVMQPDVLEIKGTTGNPEARAEISGILSDKLGAAENFLINVRYEKKLDPVLDLPSAEECVAEINRVLEVRKISFAPSSADIEEESNEIVDKIAQLMKNCDEYDMEIGGHTDSQGRETMNEELSQSRANAVLNALLARRVLTSHLTAKGYGEIVPVADNGTPEGRELNRRIEFKLTTADGQVVSEDVTITVTPTDVIPTPDAPEAENTDEQN